MIWGGLACLPLSPWAVPKASLPFWPGSIGAPDIVHSRDLCAPSVASAQCLPLAAPMQPTFTPMSAVGRAAGTLVRHLANGVSYRAGGL